MSRTIATALLFALAAPLYADGLIQRVFEQKIADDWYSHFQTWTATTCEGDKYIDTYFVLNDAAASFRVNEVKDDRLVARPLRIEGDNRSEVGEPVQFEWKDWLPKYMAGVYPVATSDDDRDVVAFAVWLYVNAKEPVLGNRALTVLYERNESMREDISEYIRERHGYKAKDKLEVAEVWDTEFAKWRRVLLSEKDADTRRKERDQAESAIGELLSEYAEREKRAMTLDQIEYAITQWLVRFSGSKTHKKEERRIRQTLEAITSDRDKIDVYTELARTLGQPDKQAEEYEKALALDPCSALLLSKAANAWQKHANPEVVGGRFICTQEHSARKAIALYERWLEREPDNVKVLLNKGVCHHVIGERDAARKSYRRVIDESQDTALAKQARDYDKLP